MGWTLFSGKVGEVLDDMPRSGMRCDPHMVNLTSALDPILPRPIAESVNRFGKKDCNEDFLNSVAETLSVRRHIGPALGNFPQTIPGPYENTNLRVNPSNTTAATTTMSPTKSPSQSTLNPKTTEYEFLGPPGALLVSLGCPLLVFALIFLCNDAGCPPMDLSTWKDQLPSSLAEFIDWRAIQWYFSFQVALVLLWAVLPGKWVRGRPLRDGTQLEYKTNGKDHVCCLSFAMFGERAEF